MLMDQEDNRAPPGFAFVVHHTPHQLLARLVCRSDSKALQASNLTHAYQQQVNRQQPACTMHQACTTRCCTHVGSQYQIVLK